MPGAFQNGVVYQTQETIHLPWFQDFRLDGGEYVINYTAKTGDAVVVDSLMSCRLKFGLIVSQSEGAVVRFKAAEKGPDGFAVITTSSFEFNALVGAGSVFPDGKHQPKGTGLLLDASEGPILWNTFRVNETIACETGVLLTCGPNGNPASCIEANTFDMPMIHLCRTHLQVGDPAANVRRNTFDARISPEGVEEAVGRPYLRTREPVHARSAGAFPGQWHHF